MLEGLRRRQTLASFDYQWARLPEGEAMLSDPWFLASVEDILAEELLAVDRSWFAGRTVLDAGCGGGRWTYGLLKLGARVLAVDHSVHALEATRRQVERLLPDALDRLETRAVDLLDLPADLRARRFDLVFSFGVLHHTGDTRRALGQVAERVAPGGLLFLYLYGRPSVGAFSRAFLAALRIGLAPLSFGLKQRVLARLFPGRDTHQAFDLFSPLVNDRYDHATVESWLRELGFEEVVRTLDTNEIFVRASRVSIAHPPGRELAPRPYWFEWYKRQ